MTPTESSLKYLRKEGWRVAIVEHWNAHARCRQDLFGFADLLAVCPTERPQLVQTTTKANAQARVDKIMALPSAGDALRGGFTIIVHGWAGKEISVQEIILDRDGKTLRVI